MYLDIRVIHFVWESFCSSSLRTRPHVLTYSTKQWKIFFSMPVSICFYNYDLLNPIVSDFGTSKYGTYSATKT